MQKTLTRPRYEIPVAEDNGPTPERAAKSVFTKGPPSKVLTAAQSLLNSEEITQEAFNAGECWHRDWVFAYRGVIEFPDNHASNTEVRHDDVSWLMTRANAAGRLRDVRDALGVCGEVRLKAMLVDELSFAKIGKAIFPALAESSARRKVATQCALVLEQLAEFYKSQWRKEKEKSCTPRAVMASNS
ncbi:hypothetical protein [Acetobacter lovaniensis]|uniref:Uncharacterized protein n=1 Tax=Acetobacter lovaniensis TaxID=104100 RepID=A0A841QIA7_9PROT|nr:hypothetical protein [Acetobacter lovaniensis]MBB6457883.1 hypothetical protein [Acetobacter lovaniensis]GBQ66268.1 hypothetical protein AA0474_1071 [Acetobacter lovaniensis NRIC 0474]